MAKKKLSTDRFDGASALAIRTRLGLSQDEFWRRLGVTQSGGSRYENDRGMPEPLKILLELVYGSEERAVRLLAELRPKTLSSHPESPTRPLKIAAPEAAELA